MSPSLNGKGVCSAAADAVVPVFSSHHIYNDQGMEHSDDVLQFISSSTGKKIVPSVVIIRKILLLVIVLQKPPYGNPMFSRGIVRRTDRVFFRNGN